MTDKEKEPAKPTPEPSREEEARRAAQEYANDQRAIAEKLRRH